MTFPPEPLSTIKHLPLTYNGILICDNPPPPLPTMMYLWVPPTYNGVLVEVIVGATSDGIELNEVVKRGDLSPHPLIFQSRLLEEASWLLDANTIQVGWSQGDYLTVNFTNHL